MASIIMFACILGVAAAHTSGLVPYLPESIPHYHLQQSEPRHGANYFDYYAAEPTPAPVTGPISEPHYVIAPVPKYIPVSYTQTSHSAIPTPYSAAAGAHIIAPEPKYIPVRYTIPVPYRTHSSYPATPTPYSAPATAHVIAPVPKYIPVQYAVPVPYTTSAPVIIPQPFPHGASAYSTLNNDVLLGTLASGTKIIKTGTYTA